MLERSVQQGMTIRGRLVLAAAIALLCMSGFALGASKAYADEPLAAGGVQDAGRTVTIDPSWTGDQVQKELTKQKSGTEPLVIEFTKGTYKFTRQLRVYSNTTLKLNGSTMENNAQSSEKRGSNDYQSMVRFGDNLKETDHVSGYEGMHDIVIQGGTFDGGKHEAALLHFSHAKDITITDMTFTNVKNSHEIEFAGCKNVKVTNCSFMKSSSSTTDAVNAEALQIDILDKHHFSDGAFDSTPSEDVEIMGCTFDGVQRGVGTHSNLTGCYHSNMNISNNTFNNIPGYAIIATSYTNSTIAGNTITNCAAGIMFRTVGLTFYPGASNNIVANMNTAIKDNKITVTALDYSTTSYGIEVYGENLKTANKNGVKGDYRTKGVTVSGNTVDLQDNGYGIWVQGSKGCTVDSNTVNVKVPKTGDGKGNGDGVRVIDSKSVKVLNNKIAHKSRNSKSKNACGIIANNSKVTIKGNTINKSNKYGISIDSKSTATITSNKVTKSKTYGIFVQKKSKATCKKNTVKKYGKYGIVAGEKSKVYAKAAKYKNKVSGKKSKAYHKGYKVGATLK